MIEGRNEKDSYISLDGCRPFPLAQHPLTFAAPSKFQNISILLRRTTILEMWSVPELHGAQRIVCALPLTTSTVHDLRSIHVRTLISTSLNMAGKDVPHSTWFAILPSWNFSSGSSEATVAGASGPDRCPFINRSVRMVESSSALISSLNIRDLKTCVAPIWHIYSLSSDEAL
jgi:hypothetical protein